MNVKELYTYLDADYEDAIKRLNNDTLISKIIKMFLSDPSFNDLKTGLETDDGELAFRGAHTLKGVCLNLGLSKLGNLAVELTELLRPRVITEQAKILFENVKLEYDKTIEAIGKLD